MSHECHRCGGSGKSNIKGGWVEVKIGEKPPVEGYPYWRDDTDGTGTYWHWWDYSKVNPCPYCQGTGKCGSETITMCSTEAAIKYGE